MGTAEEYFASLPQHAVYLLMDLHVHVERTVANGTCRLPQNIKALPDDEAGKTGHMMIVINANAFVDKETMKVRMERYHDYLQSMPVSEGAMPLCFPRRQSSQKSILCQGSINAPSSSGCLIPGDCRSQQLQSARRISLKKQRMK